jgi:hypothetical protein
LAVAYQIQITGMTPSGFEMQALKLRAGTDTGTQRVRGRRARPSCWGSAASRNRIFG